MDHTAIIIVCGAPFLVIGVFLFRWWLIGDQGLNTDPRELNADDNIHITRLDLDK